MKVKSESEVPQLCLTLRDPMDCSLPASSTHGIFQGGVLEWGAIVFSECSLRSWLHLCSKRCHSLLQDVRSLSTCCGPPSPRGGDREAPAHCSLTGRMGDHRAAWLCSVGTLPLTAKSPRLVEPRHRGSVEGHGVEMNAVGKPTEINPQPVSGWQRLLQPRANQRLTKHRVWRPSRPSPARPPQQLPP